jgi:hypothetical protein
MKRLTLLLLIVQLLTLFSHELYSQTDEINKEFGLTVGGFTNFPANKNYLTNDINVVYLAPYIRTGRHEFTAGILYPLATYAINFKDDKINPLPGATAGYKFYIFNPSGRENLFIHYSLQILLFRGDFYGPIIWENHLNTWIETDMYINNVIGLGYNLFFDTNGRFSLFYTLDYVISQAGYKLNSSGFPENSWITRFVWENLSTHIGFSFKLTSLKKKSTR